MSTADTGPYPGTGNDRAAPLARAACEAFWAAIEAGPAIQEPGAAWNWAKNQRATRAWAAAAAAAIGANLTAEASEVARLAAELAEVREGALMAVRTLERLATVMEAAWIEMQQNGPEAAMRWVENNVEPDVPGSNPDAWDGRESAKAWFDRVNPDGHDGHPCCTGCGPGCACGGSPHETGEASS